ncbi:MAG: hypothetical protein SGJ09_14410 [Phycisphaerae bacterium]|nr:hypothetical protein [Phycisphaerae bacterium]
MRIDARDVDGQRLGRIDIDLAQQPNLVGMTDAIGVAHERFLNWDGAIDDAGHVRRCLMCGSQSLYRSKVLPQVTPFVVVLAFAGAIIGLLGYASNPFVLPALVVLLIIDVATLIVARPRLVCYRCRSIYSGLRIARYHRRWDRAEAERVRATTEASQVAVSAGS